MNNQELREAFPQLSTALIADALLRGKVPVRMTPAGIRPLIARARLAGRVRPVRHYGSVGIFLEAMTTAQAGDVLVIDNQGRVDEACIGDLTVLEARAYGIAGLIVWRLHRDTADLVEIGFPSSATAHIHAVRNGLMPLSPRRYRSARIGSSS